MSVDNDTENELLVAARNGDTRAILEIQNLRTVINEKGKSKAFKGWAAIHLAAYFGNFEVVKLLLENGANVNLVNITGDTALHRAAHANRLEIVMLLLSHNADINIVNSAGETAKDVSQNKEIIRFIQAAQDSEVKRKEQLYLQAAQDGSISLLTSLLKSTNPPNINTIDQWGNTALHLAANQDRKTVVTYLLQNGIRTDVKNAKGKLAVDLARDQQMVQLLTVKPLQELQSAPSRCEGFLFRRTSFFGNKCFWTILDKGVFSQFANRADATTGSRRKSCKYLNGSRVEIDPDNGGTFVVRFGDSSRVTLTVEMDCVTAVSRQKWISAFERHIAYSADVMSKKNIFIADDDDEKRDDVLPLGSLEDALQTALAHHQVVKGQVSEVTEVIKNSNNKAVICDVGVLDMRQKLANIVDSSRDMCSSLLHAFNVLSQQEEVRRVQLAEWEEKCRVLEESLRVLAEQQQGLERSMGAPLAGPSNSDDEDDEFYDCADKLSRSLSVAASSSSTSTLSHGSFSAVAKPKFGRVTLPAVGLSRKSFSVWSILKHCIGKDLTKITMPVIFNEPLSFLQRLVEYLEYAYLLNKAVQCEDSIQRMEYVVAFAASGAASNWDRLGKPFNPLLGETYELDRPDLGYRVVCEQVSHHPPVSALHAESRDFVLHGAIQPKLKFWGKSIEITPKGFLTLRLPKYGEVYTWQNVNCCVHNIIVGKIWLEMCGTLEVTNHTTGCVGQLNFKQAGWLGNDLNKLEGAIYSDKKKMRVLQGNWTEGLSSYSPSDWLRPGEGVAPRGQSAAKAPISNGTTNSDYISVANEPSTNNQLTASNDIAVLESRASVAEWVDIVPTSTQQQTSDSVGCLLWTADRKSVDSAEYYNFTAFAMMLNETDSNSVRDLPPTDSRYRKDIRFMEEGNLDGASSEKHRLEEKQRKARKDNTVTAPIWFHAEPNVFTREDDWVLRGDYWARNWQSCPDIM